MENKKKISVVIPVYNRPEEIDELLDSMTRQDTKPDWEVVVVEDGSQVTSGQIGYKVPVEAEFRARCFAQFRYGTRFGRLFRYSGFGLPVAGAVFFHP